MSKSVAPSLGSKSYSCPHCGALAHQHWHRAYAGTEEMEPNKVVRYDSAKIDRKILDDIGDPDERRIFELWLERLEANVVTFEHHRYGINVNREMTNLHFSRCHSCKAFAVWVYGSLIYPAETSAFEPADDMPADVKTVFTEASSIYPKSPKGAAALLRLAIQILMPHLNEKGKDLNVDIGKLVAQGLSPVVQQALDVVRVIGNNAVHPGTINLDDNPETAAKLFTLVNIIVQSMISTPQQIKNMFDDLPASAKSAIEKRDGGAKNAH